MGSDAIKRYVAETPLARLSDKYRQHARDEDLGKLRNALLDQSVPPGKDVIDNNLVELMVEERAGDLQEQLNILKEMVADDIERLSGALRLCSLSEGTLVASCAQGKLHRVAIGLPAPPADWKRGADGLSAARAL